MYEADFQCESFSSLKAKSRLPPAKSNKKTLNLETKNFVLKAYTVNKCTPTPDRHEQSEEHCDVIVH